MISIPEAIQTLLTSRLMVGDNRPTATLTIEDMPTQYTGAPMITPTFRTLRGDGGATSHGGGSFVTLANGKILTTYQKNPSSGVVDIYLSTVDTEDDIFLDDNQSATNEFIFTTLAYQGDSKRNSTLKRLANGDLLLFITDVGSYSPSVPVTVKCYKSANGLGTDFTLFSTVYTDTFAYETVFQQQATTVGHVIQLSGGRMLLPFTALKRDTGWGVMQAHEMVAYSDDYGAAWSTVVIHSSWYDCELQGIGVFGSKLWCTWYQWNIGGTFGYAYSSDNGTSWTLCDAYTQLFTGNRNGSQLFWGENDGYTYLKLNNLYTGDPEIPMCSVYRRSDDLELSTTGQGPYDLTDGWELISEDLGEWYPVIWTTGAGNLALAGTRDLAGETYDTEAMVIGEYRTAANLPIKAVTIDRSKGTASQATVVLDNKLGIYAPDSSGAWNQVIWPNKQITITLGYGAEQQLVFTGLIDEVYMSSYPAELTITARDYSKLALDQVAETTIGGVTVYSFTYANKTPEYIFTAMATQAGWAAGDIHADVTGITLAEFLTGHESIADCFQRLCEITGWEWFCDELGDVYFRAATDPAAVSVYSFTEGVDIFSLDYRISDAELYRTIVVWTSDANGATLKASGEWPAADYNNILAKKTLIINAGDLVTDAAGCAAIVAAESAAITPKVREVNFVAVGNPYIQIGDVIQVTETTTTISEYYRVLEISHQMSADGSPVFSTALRCYHFSMPS